MAIQQNLYRPQWPRVGNNMDFRDNRFATVTSLRVYKESLLSKILCGAKFDFRII